MPIDANEFVRAMARDLSAEFSVDLPGEVEAEIVRTDANRGAPKALGLAEAVTLAGAILQAAQLAWEIYQAKSSRVAALNTLDEKLQTPSDLAIEERKTLIEAVVNKLFDGR